MADDIALRRMERGGVTYHAGAALRGFPGRKGAGEPSAKTLWIGMQRVMDAAITIQILRDGYDTSV